MAVLCKLGHPELVAGSGREAVQCWCGEVVDVVLMDCHMLEMDGFASTAEIRRLEGCAGTSWGAHHRDDGQRTGGRPRNVSGSPYG